MTKLDGDAIVHHVGLYLKFAGEMGWEPSLVGYHYWRWDDSPTESDVRAYGWERAISEATASPSPL